MRYVKETAGTNVLRFAAIRPDHEYEINVMLHESGDVAKVNLQLRPTVDTRPECTAAEFTLAYIKAVDRFGLFLLSLREVPTLHTCECCGTPFENQAEYFQKCAACNI